MFYVNPNRIDLITHRLPLNEGPHAYEIFWKKQISQGGSLRVVESMDAFGLATACRLKSAIQQTEVCVTGVVRTRPGFSFFDAREECERPVFKVF